MNICPNAIVLLLVAYGSQKRRCWTCDLPTSFITIPLYQLPFCVKGSRLASTAWETNIVDCHSLLTSLSVPTRFVKLGVIPRIVFFFNGYSGYLKDVWYASSSMEASLWKLQNHHILQCVGDANPSSNVSLSICPLCTCVQKSFLSIIHNHIATACAFKFWGWSNSVAVFQSDTIHGAQLLSRCSNIYF